MLNKTLSFSLSSLAILMGILGVFIFQRSAEKISSNTVHSPAPSTPSSFLASSSTHSSQALPKFQPSNPVTLQDISSISELSELQKYHQRLTTELITELWRVENSHDRDKITSRLRPVAQKFYYLNKVHRNLDDETPLSLPSSFHPEVKKLEQLWNDNNVLAESADNVFAQLDMLDCEHVPYQLRARVVSQ